MSQSTSESNTNNHYSLLTDNASPMERALEHAFKTMLERIAPPIPELNDAEKVPTNLLPYLAAERMVQEWSSDDTPENKRKTIGNQKQVFRQAGTMAGIKLAVSGIGGETDIQRWYEYAGAPYHMKARVWIDKPINLDTINRLSHRVNNAKSERDTVLLSVGAKTDASLQVCATTATASNTEVMPYSVTELNTQTELHTKAASIVAKPTTVYPYAVSKLQSSGHYRIGMGTLGVINHLVEAYNA